MKVDVLIIGGGAAGLMCAVAVKMKHPDYKVVILEKNERVGKKLLATGNGRCNLGNAYVSPQNYHSVSGGGENFSKWALEKFSPADNLAFWKKLGLLTITDNTGRQYPYTNQATSVLDVLRLNLQALGVMVLTETAVFGVEKQNDFIVKTQEEIFISEKVVLATGGMASPKISNGSGNWEWLAKFGHHSSEIFPALTQIKTYGNLPKALKGLRIPCKITLFTDKKQGKSETGELLFADYGVSGIPAFGLSREISRNFALASPKEQCLVIDALPELSEDEVLGLLKDRQERFDVSLENYLTGIVNKKLGQQIMKAVGLAPLSRNISSLSEQDIAAIAKLLKGFRLLVRGTTGWQNAQVMAGGLLLNDFDPRTMESKIVDNFFAVGEVLDIDGDCGGYNLTWAWSSARLAAENL
jgi:predicted Rossmann fold flavoprotein